MKKPVENPVAAAKSRGARLKDYRSRKGWTGKVEGAPSRPKLMRCKSDAVVLNSSAASKTETTRIFFCLYFAYAQARICGSSQNEVSKTYPKLDLIFCSSGIHNSKASWAVHCLSMHPDRFEVESRAMNRRTLYGWTKATKVSVSSETRVIHSPLSRTHNRSQLWSWRSGPGSPWKPTKMAPNNNNLQD